VITGAQLTAIQPAHAVIDGDVVPGGYARDAPVNVNPGELGFVGFINVGCTASLVAPQIALTAGHCSNTVGSTITFGRLNKDRDAGVERKITQEKNYGDTPLPGAAILIVILDRPVTQYAPIRMAAPGDSAIWSQKRELIDYGWGYINDTCAVGGPKPVYSAELRSATMKVIDTAVSTGIYRNTAKVQSVHGRPTHGDSGSPLVGRDRNGQLALVGIFEAHPAAPCTNNGFKSQYYYNRIWTQQKLRDWVSQYL
jgi:hypothetical protein